MRHEHVIVECDKRVASIGGLRGSVKDLEILDGAAFVEADALPDLRAVRADDGVNADLTGPRGLPASIPDDFRTATVRTKSRLANEGGGTFGGGWRC